MENNIVSVMLWGEEVGKIYWDTRSKRAVFSYNPDFIRKGIDVAPLTAPINSAAAKGFPVVGSREKLYQGLPPFLLIPCLTGGVTRYLKAGLSRIISRSTGLRRLTSWLSSGGVAWVRLSSSRL